MKPHLIMSYAPPKIFLVKHTFNADTEAESLLQAATKALRDKTEFINRCIQYAGPAIIKTINDERNQAVAEVLRENTGKGISKARKTAAA
jgi:hypothetical protein